MTVYFYDKFHYDCVAHCEIITQNCRRSIHEYFENDVTERISGAQSRYKKLYRYSCHAKEYKNRKQILIIIKDKCKMLTCKLLTIWRRFEVLFVGRKLCVESQTEEILKMSIKFVEIGYTSSSVPRRRTKIHSRNLYYF